MARDVLSAGRSSKKCGLIQGVVLDLGGVLVQLDSRPFFKVFGHPKWGTVEEFVDQIEVWEMYDLWERGGCSEDDFFKAFKVWAGFPSLSQKEFRTHWNGIFPGGLKGAGLILRKLKTKYRLYALSNTTDTHFEYMKKHFRFLKEFDRIFTSFGLKARKPEPVIFERMLKELQMDPKTLLYIDDRQENIETAKNLGFITERCPGPTHLEAILEKHGLLS
jgi:FMN phosphatase YigB (HAD superfamily)